MKLTLVIFDYMFYVETGPAEPDSEISESENRDLTSETELAESPEHISSGFRRVE